MPTKSHTQSGFALILAILALMLLTFLGLTLSATTSTELQIATNYRWGQQAYYNAEAGIEAAKIVLRNVQNNWNSILPTARTGTWAPQTALAGHNCKASQASCAPASVRPPVPVDPVMNASRNWEGAECDRDFGIGYGAVLDDFPAVPLANGQVPAAGPYQNVTSFQGLPVNGAFTLWVRREIVMKANGEYQDFSPLSGPTAGPEPGLTLVLTSEGVAPVPANAASAAFMPRAVRVLQVKLLFAAPGSPCDQAGGNSGVTASGANMNACPPLGGDINDPTGGAGRKADTGAR